MHMLIFFHIPFYDSYNSPFIKYLIFRLSLLLVLRYHVDLIVLTLLYTYMELATFQQVLRVGKGKMHPCKVVKGRLWLRLPRNAVSRAAVPAIACMQAAQHDSEASLCVYKLPLYLVRCSLQLGRWLCQACAGAE